jgi:hypothetical protein
VDGRAEQGACPAPAQRPATTPQRLPGGQSARKMGRNERPRCSTRCDRTARVRQNAPSAKQRDRRRRRSAFAPACGARASEGGRQPGAGGIGSVQKGSSAARSSSTWTGWVRPRRKPARASLLVALGGRGRPRDDPDTRRGGGSRSGRRGVPIPVSITIVLVRVPPDGANAPHRNRQIHYHLYDYVIRFQRRGRAFAFLEGSSSISSSVSRPRALYVLAAAISVAHARSGRSAAAPGRARVLLRGSRAARAASGRNDRQDRSSISPGGSGPSPARRRRPCGSRIRTI